MGIFGLFRKQPAPEKTAPAKSVPPSQPPEELFRQGMAAYQKDDYAAALPLLRQAAEQGYADAQHWYGYMLDCGEGTAANAAEAFRWYEKAAAQGHKVSMYNCGMVYVNTTVDDVDYYEEAMACFVKSSELGYAKSQYMQGYLYDNGLGVPEDKGTALSWYRKAARQNIEEAILRCAEMCQMGEGTEANPQEALYWFEKAARLGYIDAQFQCAELYLHGEGADQDKQAAFSWMEMAAQGGHVEACCQCGWMYYFGNGAWQNLEKALYWFEKAAEQGHEGAQLQCSVMYENGEGTEVNLYRALQWYEEAAWKGNPNVQYICGLLYEQEQGPAVSWKDAHYWYGQAAAQGHAQAQFRYGFLYFQGMGTEMDMEQALEWLDKAASAGEKDAARLAAFINSILNTAPEEIYALAESVYQKNRYREAITLFQIAAYMAQEQSSGEDEDWQEDADLAWYEQAAARGDRDAQYWCGVMYENGEDTAVDAAKALRYYEQAAKQGHADAQARCGYLYLHGIGTDFQVKKAVAWLDRAEANGAEGACLLAAFARNAILDASPEELFDRGSNSFESKRYDTALHLFRLAASQDLPEAHFFCGLIYELGLGTEQDNAEAFRWYEQAAILGDAEGQAALARLYDKGYATELNRVKALYWYEQAAEQDQPYAMYKCGCLYLRGDGVAPNPEKARYWLEQTARRLDEMPVEDIQALNMTGTLFEVDQLLAELDRK